MKIAVCSDIHLEFGPIVLDNPGDVEVLILSGDICVAADMFPQNDPYGIIDNGKYATFQEFFETCSKNFPHVVYIMGNHEHYHGDFAVSHKILRDFLKPYPNIHFLDKECWTHNDVTFIGGTLWTDMNKEDSLTLSHIKGVMNDYRGVKNTNKTVSYKVPTYKTDESGNYVYEGGQLVTVSVEHKSRPATFSPEDSVEDHKAMLGYVRTVVEGKFDKKFVVVGHHAPSKQSTHPRYKHEVVVNGAYSSDLNEFILERPQIKLWTHGHTHEVFDYMIGSTRIVCNPRGYINYEQRADDFELKVVEV